MTYATQTYVTLNIKNKVLRKRKRTQDMSKHTLLFIIFMTLSCGIIL